MQAPCSERQVLAQDQCPVTQDRQLKANDVKQPRASEQSDAWQKQQDASERLSLQNKRPSLDDTSTPQNQTRTLRTNINLRIVEKRLPV